MRTVRPPKQTQLLTITCTKKTCTAIVEAALCELAYTPPKTALDDGSYTYRCPHCGDEQVLDEGDLDVHA